jgi:hypothetical protein
MLVLVRECLPEPQVSDEMGDLFAQLTDQTGWIPMSESSDAEKEHVKEEHHEPKATHAHDGEMDDELDEMWDEMHIQSHATGGPVAIDISTLPQLLVARLSIALCSTVLSGSELVTDKELKTRVLCDTLGGWADYCALLSNETHEADFREQFANNDTLVQLVGEDNIDSFIDHAFLLMPVLSALGGITSTLNNAKLAELVRDVLSDEEFFDQAGRALMGVLLSQHLRAPGWSRDMLKLIERHGRRRVVNEIILWLSSWTYSNAQQLNPAEVRDIEETVATAYLHHSSFSSEIHRNQAKSQVLQNLRKSRVRQRMVAEVERKASPLELE